MKRSVLHSGVWQATACAVFLKSAAFAQQPAILFEETFENGLPEKWEAGALLDEGLPQGSRGAAAAKPGEDLKSNANWVKGHFAVEPDLCFNYWVRLDDPQWYQVFLFCKAPGTEAKDMSLYEAKPEVSADAAGQWRLVSIPFSAFKALMGPNKGNAPKPGEVCWSYFWGLQKRPLGLAVDKVWVSRGKPVAAEPPPPAAAAKTPEVSSVPTWAFEPARDAFSADALLDLRSLNEPVAGLSGWVKATSDGDFARGDGQPIRFWAINTDVDRERPFQKRPQWKEEAPDLSHHARWLAKRGVNMVRLHAHINPSVKARPGAAITDADAAELEWIWRTVGAMKQAGIYATVSPYWASSMQSDDAKWGTDWAGNHFGLLFFDEKLQAAYKAWLKALFTTPTPALGGKTLAQEPALAIFQIQNEDSLLFWTIQSLKDEPKRRFGKRFGAWAAERYGSLEAALKAWGDDKMPGDDPAAGVLDFKLVWNMTADARRQKNGQGKRLDDQLAFWTEAMRRFNKTVADYVHGDLKCPVLVNAGNWRTADTVLLNDAERYSYTACDVLAVNRYFGGLHTGPNNGWAIMNGDTYASDSALTDSALSFPLALKQVKGFPMMITESSWVFPNAYAAEGPFLVSVYSGLTGFDAYYWFSTGTEEWTPPQSANGYMPSQQKWICATPDMVGQFPAAALAFRRGYVKRGEPAVEEHRALASLWARRTPIIAESAAFDPNRDAGDIAPASSVKTGLDPYAFLAGPVTAVYDSDESKTRVADLKSLIRREANGVTVKSVTGEIELSTGPGFCTVNAPKCQGVAAHFKNRQAFDLADLSVRCENAFGTVMAVPLDDQPLATSKRVLVQVGMPCRPTGWRCRPTSITPEGGQPTQGWRVTDFGHAPWAVETPKLQITLRNRSLTHARALDANGLPVADVAIKDGTFAFPGGSLYAVAE